MTILAALQFKGPVLDKDPAAATQNTYFFLFISTCCLMLIGSISTPAAAPQRRLLDSNGPSLTLGHDVFFDRPPPFENVFEM